MAKRKTKPSAALEKQKKQAAVQKKMNKKILELKQLTSTI